MTAPHEPVVSSRRRWSRFLYQYSLRTLLIVTTLAAVACWWFLQPAIQDEQVAGRFLKLRRQIGKQRQPATPNPYEEPDFVNVGSWQLRDENDYLLASGRFQHDQAHGHWTTWHTSGRKAAEGRAEHGIKSGVWRTWDACGQQLSEAAYLVEPFVPAPGDHEWTWEYPGNYLRLRSGVPKFGYQALRHGSARQWHANGQLRCEGQYDNDRREGLWTEFDEQGRIVQQGMYKGDLRDGAWTAGGQQLHYVAGRLKHDHEKLVDQIVADLESGNIRRQVAAAEMLQQLGSAGTPVLARVLADGSTEAQLLALRSLVRCDAVPEDLLPRIEPLVDHTDQRLAVQAMLALYPHRPDRQEQWWSRLVAVADESKNSDARLELLCKLCELDPHRLPQTMQLLIELLARRERPATELAINSLVRYDAQRSQATIIRDVLATDADLLPHLERALQSRDTYVRRFVVKLLKDMVQSQQPIGYSENKGTFSAEVEWQIHQRLQPLVEAAQADSDPKIREMAHGITKAVVRTGATGMGRVGPGWTPGF